MSANLSRRRQQLWQLYRALARTLRNLQREPPMVQGSFYLLRRTCGKPTCRCTRGQRHATWVITRSEAGRRRLYSVPAAQRRQLRTLTWEYRRWQLARARLVKQTATLLARVDRLAEHRLQPWPRPHDHEPRTD
jgi:hypothetical protein